MTVATDRARKHTAESVLRRIDDDTAHHLLEHEDTPGKVSERLAALDREWDLDRVIEAEASVMGLVGLTLGALVRREFFGIPLVVGGAVFLYATTGRYPLLPLFRRLGVRTAGEIARERYALKALRGDFALPSERPGEYGAADKSGRGARPGLGMVGSESLVQKEN